MSADTTQVEQIEIKPQTASTVSTWLNRVFVVVVLVAIPLLYWFGYIGAVWLNRIGIVLNFCAGFMLAPELIGIARLKKLNDNISNKHTLLSKRVYWFSLRGHLLMLGVLANEVAQSGNISSMLKNKLSHLKELKELYENQDGRDNPSNFSWNDFWQDIFWASKQVIRTLIGTVIIFLSVLCSKMIDFVYNIFDAILSFIARKLVGDNRLRSILVWWGIIFFIVGNLLQFISTF